MQKNEKGITLIVLSVIIIVLIILASISIAVIIGEEGIISQTKIGKEETEKSEEKESINISIVQAIGEDRVGNLNNEILQSKLDSNVGEGKTEVTDLGDSYEVIFNESDRYYEIEKDGSVGEAQKIIKDDCPGDITKDLIGKELEGTEEKPFEIWCIEDLIEWSQNYSLYQDSYIKLCKTLNFKSKISYENSKRVDYGDINQDGNIEELIKEMQKGIGFTPIEAFYGVFQGNNNGIKNIYINSDGMGGLIKQSRNCIKNLYITGNITASSTAGSVAAKSTGIIKNCKNYAKIFSEEDCAGGICGFAGEITFEECYNEGIIEAKLYAGGILGYEYNSTVTILNCKNVGDIKAASSARWFNWRHYCWKFINL